MFVATFEKNVYETGSLIKSMEVLAWLQLVGPELVINEYICVCTHTHVCVYMCIYIYIYIYILKKITDIIS